MTDSRPWQFYMLRCADGSLYTGIALDANERVRVHNAGQGADYTARRRPVVLVYVETHPSRLAARGRETQVKGWRAAKKEALVRGLPSASSG
jgi:predicted GIY-YIG superfamily endonuclease